MHSSASAAVRAGHCSTSRAIRETPGGYNPVMKAHPLDAAAVAVAQRANERALDALSLLRVPTTPDQRWQQQLRRYSIAAAIGDLCHERRTGIAAEVHEELMSRGQMPQQPNSILVP